ncbi:MAG: chalcone isomerase family protein [Thermoanaerobaculales bacterium]
MKRNLVVWAVMLVLALPAAAMELAGVTLPDAVTVGGTTLKLNGMGVRKKLWIKVYVGGLYLAAPSHDTVAIFAADAPRQMVMHFLYKEVDKAKLTGAWREGFANNSAASLPVLQARLDTFCSWWLSMKSGERAVITYVPATGTRLETNGKELGTIPGKDFADALFLVWLGDKPADAGLKEGMLGK